MTRKTIDPEFKEAVLLSLNGKGSTNTHHLIPGFLMPLDQCLGPQGLQAEA
jgi:hypothetical protein